MSRRRSPVWKRCPVGEVRRWRRVLKAIGELLIGLRTGVQFAVLGAGFGAAVSIVGLALRPCAAVGAGIGFVVGLLVDRGARREDEEWQ
jgi:hypothetical protein